jgi:predicted acetyltransferase
VGAELAGFALISRGSRVTDDPAVWDMTDFFVLRGYRKRGIGASAAAAVWRRFPGRWQVRVMDSNRPARAFWAATVGAFTGGAAEQAAHWEQGRSWNVFSFVSSDSGDASPPPPAGDAATLPRTSDPPGQPHAEHPAS